MMVYFLFLALLAYKMHVTCVEIICESGYYFNGAICEPICLHCDQSYGICTAPNVCECPAGFLIGLDDIGRTICVPQCSNCSNLQFCYLPEQYFCGCVDCQGDCRHCNISDPLDIPVCTVPEYCACKGGYSYINNECIPVCSPACNEITQECKRVNEVNVCVCRNGYSGLTCQECGFNQNGSTSNHYISYVSPFVIILIIFLLIIFFGIFVLLYIKSSTNFFD
jgi:hypothetical protein